MLDKTLDQTKRISILFLAANPTNSHRLRLDEEIRSIDNSLRLSKYRNNFDLQQHWAVRTTDIQELLLRHKPDIVHFSGHGNNSSELIFEDAFGKGKPVSSQALSQLFSIFQNYIRCVLLNACYSQEQAKAIAEHIDCVVGMSNAIGDAAAINFATSFYRGLGYGTNVAMAFKLACNEISLQNIHENDTPQLISLRSDPSEIEFIAA